MARIAAANANRFIMFLDSIQVHLSGGRDSASAYLFPFVSFDLVDFVVQINCWGRELDSMPGE